VLFPAPEGPTNAIFSPLFTLKLMSLSAGLAAVGCVNVTFSNAMESMIPTFLGFDGNISGVLSINILKLFNETSVSE